MHRSPTPNPKPLKQNNAHKASHKSLAPNPKPLKQNSAHEARLAK
jgi:hypothetical protein